LTHHGRDELVHVVEHQQGGLQLQGFGQTALQPRANG
jgi:hypothetical protein